MSFVGILYSPASPRPAPRGKNRSERPTLRSRLIQLRDLYGRVAMLGTHR